MPEAAKGETRDAIAEPPERLDPHTADPIAPGRTMPDLQMQGLFFGWGCL
ncbi:hypothetical protein [Acidithiobacillus sp. 'AMD consortium']|nr:hypothetical protein [Acidithiobacillus sp. 'AMD consortium']